MRVTAVALLLAGAGCSTPASPDSASRPGAPAQAAQPWGRDPFTRTSQIEIDGNLAGYLVSYEPIPAGVEAARALPTGSYRIQARDFEDVGFISPRGEVRRHAASGSVSLGTWDLESGLLLFFGGGQRVRLAAIEPAPARRPVAATAPEAGAEAGDLEHLGYAASDGP